GRRGREFLVARAAGIHDLDRGGALHRLGGAVEILAVLHHRGDIAPFCDFADLDWLQLARAPDLLHRPEFQVCNVDRLGLVHHFGHQRGAVGGLRHDFKAEISAGFLADIGDDRIGWPHLVQRDVLDRLRPDHWRAEHPRSYRRTRPGGGGLYEATAAEAG